jgi:tetratricopeptide (TPR) repeat protein
LKRASASVAVALLLQLMTGCASSDRFLWEEYTGLGVAAISVGDYREAEQYLNRALVKAGSLGPAEQGITLNGLGELNRRQSRLEEAERLFTRSLALKEAANGPDHLDVATTLANLGLVYLAQDRAAEALPLLERALTIQQARGARPATLERTLTALAETYRRLGQEDKAQEVEMRRRLLPAARERRQ